LPSPDCRCGNPWNPIALLRFLAARAVRAFAGKFRPIGDQKPLLKQYVQRPSNTTFDSTGELTPDSLDSVFSGGYDPQTIDNDIVVNVDQLLTSESLLRLRAFGIFDRFSVAASG
jgi:hypothetical protein